MVETTTARRSRPCKMQRIRMKERSLRAGKSTLELPNSGFAPSDFESTCASDNGCTSSDEAVSTPMTRERRSRPCKMKRQRLKGSVAPVGLPLEVENCGQQSATIELSMILRNGFLEEIPEVLVRRRCRSLGPAARRPVMYCPEPL
mmetsp:Transcript_371/g.595  ORF Transcript_371/g.595 Transcript_371/m.595 type:complete len:146 (-) Transcript_371:129-566(-)